MVGVLFNSIFTFKSHLRSSCIAVLAISISVHKENETALL